MKDGVLSSLDDVSNVEKVGMEVPALIKPALDSTSNIIKTIKESTMNIPDKAGLELTCTGICEVLNQGMNQMHGDRLSQSALEAIDQVVTSVDEINRCIIKQGKRSMISRVIHPKRDKQAIDTWKLNLNGILCLLSAELGPNAHPTAYGVTAPHPPAPGVHPDSSNVEIDARAVVPRNTVESYRDTHDQDHATYTRALEEPLVYETVDNLPGVLQTLDIFENTHSVAAEIPKQIGEDADSERWATQNNVPGESPPPPPRIFGRDELVEKIVDQVDAEYPVPIALIGTGGIGKTSVGLTVLHDDRIKQRFGDHRRLLRCDQFPPSLPLFLSRLCEVIGAGVENPTDLASLRPFLSRKMFILLDNAESIFDGPGAKDITPVVEELSKIRNICLCITSRTSNVPSGCKIFDVPTLSMEAACETFYHTYRHGEQSNTVDRILKQLDFHPLSIVLLATAARRNKWRIDQLAKEWDEQRTLMLRTRYEGSLAATIEFSLRSPMFQELGPHARDLLGVIGFFPLGVDEKNLDWLFPTIANRENIFDRFSVLSLTYRSKGFVTMLAPLRDHFCPKDPTSASLLCLTKEQYFTRLSVSLETMTPTDDKTQWITSEDVNVEHLLDVFTLVDANSEGVWDACRDFIQHLWLHKPRPLALGPRIERLPDDYPSKPQCLLDLSELLSRIKNSAGAQRFLSLAIKLYRKRGDNGQVAKALRKLSLASFELGLIEEGIQQAKEAMTISRQIGDIVGVIGCHIRLSSLFRHVERLDEADECESQLIEVTNTLLASSYLDPMLRGLVHDSLAQIYFNKGDMEKATSHAEAALGIGGMTVRSNLFTRYHTMARIHMENGRLDDAEALLEHARSLAADDSSEHSRLVLLRAHLLVEQGKLEEARSEAPRALDLLQEYGAVDQVEEAEDLIQLIDEGMLRNAAMRDDIDALREGVAHWTRLRSIRAALGEEVPQDDETSEAVMNLMTLFENRAYPIIDPEVRKALEECLALLGHDFDEEQLDMTSLESSAISEAADEVEETVPLEALIPRGNRPAVIMAMYPKFAHIGQLWQSLYYVPQVRHRISQYRGPPSPGGATGADSVTSVTEGQVSSVHELFESMELSDEAIFTGWFSMELFPLRPWESVSPREDVEKAYKDFSEAVETCLNDGIVTRHPDWPRLFHSRINDGTPQERSTFDTERDFSLIPVRYNDEDGLDDLVKYLAIRGFPKQGLPNAEHTTTGERVVMEVADMIAFALARDESPPPQVAEGSQQRKKFSFPESLRLDQLVTISRRRSPEEIISEEEQPGTELPGSSSVEQFQQDKFDLRAVLMHDGLTGREHVYSYINHNEAWWKIVNYAVTQVTLETVLNDESGMDLGAGPFFLIYSRSLPEPLKSEWPGAPGGLRSSQFHHVQAGSFPAA